ncbi:MAG: hypothetical protein WB760_10525 [Xanthobacteraceae bacterium]
MDDLELAYTLLVASVESLAQKFDDHKGVWTDVEEQKRSALDKALEGSDLDFAQRVREALIRTENLAMARRFRAFALDHIPKGYYSEVEGRRGAFGRLDLRDALREAYRLRSRYVHNLLQLPSILSVDFSFSESVSADHRIFLTFQGLARLAREVILEFVRRRPKVDSEVYDFSLERHGVIRAELAPRHWIGRVESLRPDSGRKHLEAFLEQLAGHVQAGDRITDLTAVMLEIEQLLPKLDAQKRRPFISLYYLYNKIVPKDKISANFAEVIQQYKNELFAPSPEALVTHHVLGSAAGWSLEESRTQYDYYFDHRNSSKGFRVPAIIEATMTLDLAERYRVSGEIDSARSLLAFAVDNFPYIPKIKELSIGFSPEAMIDSSILLPKRDQKEEEPTGR